MTVEEIFSKIDVHSIEGMMYHEQLADYFGFLNLKGYECLHRHRFLEETKELSDLHEYFLDTYGHLLPQNKVGDPKIIPENWLKYSKIDVDRSNKERFIVNGFKIWVDWELETKALYNEACKVAEENNDNNARSYFMTKLCDVCNELIYAQQIYCNVHSVSGNLEYVLTEQDNFISKYKEV